MNHLEYILGYGLAGDFGRFRAAEPVALSRGGRAIVGTHRGVEIGQVLRPAAPGHALFLPNTSVGKLLRPAGLEDEARAAQMSLRAGEVLAHGANLIQTLNLPVALLDAEMLFDGEHVVLHYLSQGPCDIRELVSRLSRQFAVHVALIDLTAPVVVPVAEEHGCGSCGSGGCGDCGSGGGGGCGSCGSVKPVEAKPYFAGLREKMEQRRVPLN